MQHPAVNSNQLQLESKDIGSVTDGCHDQALAYDNMNAEKQALVNTGQSCSSARALCVCSSPSSADGFLRRSSSVCHRAVISRTSSSIVVSRSSAPRSDLHKQMHTCCHCLQAHVYLGNV